MTILFAHQFPWVLRDYASSELDLTKPDTYRDFSRPMGAQNPRLWENLKTKCVEF